MASRAGSGSGRSAPCGGAARMKVKAAVRASSASVQEKLTAGLTAATVAATLVLSEVKNFLLSIVSGGVVFADIAGAVVAVYNFNPVKRT
ncbi:hypothetical protein D1007_39772 [Hordeum vulgare]|nr:hypothetical protein D1007_39772 [Hordeum vulgare]